MRRLTFTLLFVLILDLTGNAQRIDSLFVSAAISKLKHSKEYTMKVAELMPEANYAFKPAPTEMSFGEQLIHLCSNMGWLCSSYLSKSADPVTESDLKLVKKQEILHTVSKTYDFALNVLQHFDLMKLADTVSFFAGPMSKLQIVNLLNDHQTHHRAQMLVYLRLNGIKPPDYVGW